jgi:polyhydroxyalkanoate synthesis repressor PhaR
MENIFIKKYGNRRFYSSKEKSYVTLSEIKTWVQKGHHIQVADAETNKDITSEILTQILLEQGRASHFPAELLEQMIRMNEKALNNIWAPIIEQNLKMMAQMGEVALSGIRLFAKRPPLVGKNIKIKKKSS